MRYTVVPRGANGSTGRILEIGGNLKTGEDDFAREFQGVTSLESDLLTLGAAVFAADRGTARDPREEYPREIMLSVPVVNAGRLAPLSRQLETVLTRLSDDAWTVRFTQLGGAPENGIDVQRTPGKTLLFSGGLDSLAAAVEYGHEPGGLELVSHRTRNTVTGGVQRSLAERLTTHGFPIRHHQYFVSSTDAGLTPFDHDAENTQRTRSFMFLVLGALVARRTGKDEVVYIAENGQLAIHLPLTSGRIGAFSTHTAHPSVLRATEALLSVALEWPLHIHNPYLYRTKREVVEVVQRHLPEAVVESTSCWRNARLPAGTTHCGDCVPCQVRRIAVEHAGPDPTAYARNLWIEPIANLPPDDDGRRNLADLTEFVYRFRHSDDESITAEFPELLSEDFDGVQAMAMYRRFADEAFTVLSRYPTLQQFLR